MSTIYHFFSSGILYVFGFSNNPLLNEQYKYKTRNDADVLRGDWEKVGMYIKNAYEHQKQSAK